MQLVKLIPVVGKKPAIKDWQRLATSDESVLTSWLDQFGNGQAGFRWGMPTGAANMVTVLDVDMPKGGETLRALGLADWAESQNKHLTPRGGYHIYCAYTPGVKTTAGVLGEGLDVRNDGGYVVLYDDDSGELPDLNNLPEFPSILKPKPKESPKPKLSGAVEGGRNHYLTSVAGRLQKLNLLTVEALQAINDRDCTPPLPEQEVINIALSVGRYEPELSLDEEAPKVIWAKNLFSEMLNYLSDKNLVRGEPTGLMALDELLGGGKRLGELSVTLAEAKTGKNTLWHQLMVTWLDKGIPVAYASRELSPEEEVLPNLLSVKLRKNMLKGGQELFSKAELTLANWRLAFASGYGAMPDDQLFQWMDACKEDGIKHFFIDHLHYLLEDPEDFKGISKLIRKLKAYTKAHKVHVDLIVQPKILDPGMRLGLNSLRGGASIGQALDNLLTLQRVRNEEGSRTNVMKVCLEAARHKLASLGEFYLQYDPETMTFIEVVPAAEATEEVAPVPEKVLG